MLLGGPRKKMNAPQASRAVQSRPGLVKLMRLQATAAAHQNKPEGAQLYNFTFLLI